jgi:hypothetical protein
VGVESGLALGLPLVLLTAYGPAGMGLQAVLGAFMALYAAGLSRRDRLPTSAAVGRWGLVLAATLDVVCVGKMWLASACVVIVNALACTLTLGVRLGLPAR